MERKHAMDIFNQYIYEITFCTNCLQECFIDIMDTGFTVPYGDTVVRSGSYEVLSTCCFAPFQTEEPEDFDEE